ncbi:MAG: enoyl-CoA hydratase/isomerase family protein [Flavobacteriales bacterium]|nr:enoyl-CoA hydratase/isomerase family protein [Flavobacteriales bacterium]
MEKIVLSYSYNDSIAHILLNDGKGNVLDNVMMLEILDCLQQIQKQNNIKLITFQGEGKHFSFGASVEEHTQDLAPVMLQTFHKIFLTLVEMQVPTLAKISGQCLGGGLELALICNFLFADKTAKLGQPEIVLGVFPPPASIILPEKIGLARAEELLLTGRTMDATEALQMGLINHIFEDKEALNIGTNEWIEKYILPKSASSLRFATKAARIKFHHVLNNFLPQLEAYYTRQLMTTHDANEGIQAFLEKRNPDWKNL